MTDETERIADEAARWHIAALSDDCDWDGFTRWLERDPRHAAAYDGIALADAMAVSAGPPRPLEDHAETPLARPRRWPLWAGGAVAASLALVLGISQLTGPSATTYTTAETARTIALADGSRVRLAPDSRLTVEGERLALDGGGFFSIHHDPARTMVVRAGALDVTDIGTEFDIQASAQATRIAVAEGRVTVRGQALSAPVDLPAGKRIVLDIPARRATVSGVAVGDVGAWRQGQLSYTDTTLGIVAADLERYTRVKLTVPRALQDRHFSGTLSASDGASAVRDLAAVMGLSVSGSDRRFVLHAAR